MANTPNYDINYEDERFTNVKAEESQQLTELEQTYNGMIDQSDKYFSDLKDSTQQWADKQSQIQQEQTDFTIEQIEQQKEQAQKDYTKEQAGAYVDWQKQSNQYGVNAEKMASAGLTDTGFSESSQVSMYNTYQNRVATARESYNQAVLNYNNAIKDARLQNNAALAEIAANALQQQLELSLQGFQYKNQLISELSDKKMQTKQFYATQWQNVLDQMNKEIDRQFTADQNELERQWKEKEAQLDRDFQTQRDKLQQEFEAAQAELNRQHDFALVEANTKAEKERADYEHKLAMEQLAKEQAYKLEQLDKQLANEKAMAKYEYDLANQNKSGTISGGGSSGGTSSKSVSYSAPVTKSQLVSKMNETKPSTTGKTTQATLNSITALGYGPISAAKLDQLVASGAVIEYVSNGVTLFRKANAQLKTSALYKQLQKPASVSLPTSKLRK
jgi:hypothetical protein